MTEWHARYKGRGVMIYWHVDRKSACIHSQLKTCSSSEVAAMIHGVLRHCTEMSVDRQYVDSHGQNKEFIQKNFTDQKQERPMRFRIFN